ncbi:MAG: alpha/beta fold hydrolase [Pseudomonadota bacterium]
MTKQIARSIHRIPSLLLVAPVIAVYLLPLGPVRGETFDTCQPSPILHQSYDEQIISIETPDGRIEGTVASPSSATPKALTLMLHGYTGARNEIRGMYRRTAQAFAERGIATLRIDFIGSGQSDGAWADTRFSTQARDAVRAAEALLKKYDETLPVSVLGYSQGGLVALRAAASDDPFDRLALWNPVMDPMATYGIIFGEETILEAAERHRLGESGDIIGETRLRSGFFAEIATADPSADAARSKAEILIVTGQRDPLVKNGAALAKRMADTRSADTTILDLDAGHDLGALQNTPLLDQVIACTAGFLLSKGGGNPD